MKNLLKKLHVMSNQTEGKEELSSSTGSKTCDVVSSPDRLTQARPYHFSEHKPFSGLSSWLNSVTNRHGHGAPSSSNVIKGEPLEPSDSVIVSGVNNDPDAPLRDSESNSRDPDVEEEYQIQLAMELSAREDPEAVQIEAVKQISLGSCAPDNTPAEVIAYRYWVSCHLRPLLKREQKASKEKD